VRKFLLGFKSGLLTGYGTKLILGFSSNHFKVCVMCYGTPPVCKMEDSSLSEDAAGDLVLETGGRHYEAGSMHLQ
jgi:hypothetical protein